jgi:phosphomannomutase
MKNIVLFDMDGTLTEPRKKIKKDMIEQMKSLVDVAQIGIVTGSSYDYLVEQCDDMWKEIDPSLITLLPCNGTQVYRWSTKDDKYIQNYSVNMIKDLSRLSYAVIIMSCLKYQRSIMEFHDLPYTGTFLHYRESMLNWCPIGRNANDRQRNAWIKEDNSQNIRERFREHLIRDMKTAEIPVEITLGGSTSFDIYPAGWDKTYCLQHFSDMDHWFVGDNCTGFGNDRKIYEHILPTGKSYITASPDNTLSIIYEIKNKIKNKKLE